MSDSRQLPAKVLLGIAVLQGIALWLLYRSDDLGFWPSAAPIWKFPLWSLAIAVPAVLLLSLERDNVRGIVRQLAGLAAAIAVLGVYVGSQAEPYAELQLYSLTIVYVLTMGLACFKALMYMQQRASGRSMAYDVLFTFSWRNFLTIALAGMFVLAFWLLLMLWAQLFKTIGIDFFRELFAEEWFLFPVLGCANGLGIIIFRNLTGVIDSITRLLRGLIKLLLPLALFVAALFVAVLPFVGLDSLWSTGRGTSLLLWLLAVVLFFVNAVYQDGRGELPYPAFVHRALYGGMLVLPIISLLSLYGLTLRLMQYGWTVERCWAFVAWLLLSLIAFGYVYGIVRRRDLWMEQLARVNTLMGLLVLAIMLLANSPVLDFRKLSLASQLARVESAEIELRDFDFWYAKTALARPGYLAIEKIKSEIGDTDPDLLAKIERPYRTTAAQQLMSPSEYWPRVVLRPEDFTLPPGLRQEIARAFPQIHDSIDPLLIRADLSEHGGDEFVLLLAMNDYPNQARVFYREEGVWKSVMAATTYVPQRDATPGQPLRDAEVLVEDPMFRQLRIGGVTIRASEDGVQGIRIITDQSLHPPRAEDGNN